MSSTSGSAGDKYYLQCQAGLVYIDPENIPDVEEIYINGNPITKILDNTFAAKTCRIMSLAYNQIQTLMPLAFKDMFLLEKLFLNDNYIDELPSGIFDQINTEISRLTHLYLQNNRLQSLAPGLFIKVTTLTYLDLQENRLLVIGEELSLELGSIDSVLVSIRQGRIHLCHIHYQEVKKYF